MKETGRAGEEKVSMLYDVFMAVLTAVGITGALVFSFKVARSPIRRVGVIRELPDSHGFDEKVMIHHHPGDLVTQVAGKAVAKKGEAWPLLVEATSTTHLEPQIAFSPKQLRHYFQYKKVVTAFDLPFSIVEVEDCTTVDLQGKVKDLEERLKKLESESLRKSQESRNKESEEQVRYIQ